MRQQNEVASVQRGEPMTREKANEGKPNPDYEMDNGYRNNCMACVVAYEARLQGYDVEAASRTGNDKMEILAQKAAYMAWLDPKTNVSPYPAYVKGETHKELIQRLEREVEHGRRYMIRFDWARDTRYGHVMSVDRNEEGLLRLYDPQNGITRIGGDMDRYLERAVDVGVLRIDDKLFNLDIADHILRKARP